MRTYSLSSFLVFAFCLTALLSTPAHASVVAEHFATIPLSVPFGATQGIQINEYAGGWLVAVALDGRDELWTTDGTQAGTQLLADGPNGFLVDYPNQARSWKAQAHGSDAVFAATDSEHGTEPWITDGTPSGTHILKDINPGVAASCQVYAEFWPLEDGTLVFRADDAVHGNELWRTDGTELGTVFVKDLIAGEGYSNPGHWTQYSNAAYFVALAQEIQGESTPPTAALWTTDGTAEGTVALSAIAFAVPEGGLFSCTATALGIVLTGDSLRLSDGTASTLTMLYGGPTSPVAELNGALYFIADDASHKAAVWRSNGSSAASLIASTSLDGSGYWGEWYPPTVLNGVAYFYRHGTTNTLVATDGTAAGTHVLSLGDSEDVVGDLPSAGYVNPIQGAGTWTLFAKSESATGSELYRGDGTLANVELLKDVLPGPTSGNPAFRGKYGDIPLFTATDATGRRLYATDGTSAGTGPLLADNGEAVGDGFVAVFDNAVLVATPEADVTLRLWQLTSAPSPKHVVVCKQGGFVEEGDEVVLLAWDGGTGYQWYKDGTTLHDDAHVEGATTSQLTIHAVTTADSGSYYCTFSDDTLKVLQQSSPYVIEVVAAGSLPVALPIALGGVALAFAAAGARRVLRRK